MDATSLFQVRFKCSCHKCPRDTWMHTFYTATDKEDAKAQCRKQNHFATEVQVRVRSSRRDHAHE